VRRRGFEGLRDRYRLAEGEKYVAFTQVAKNLIRLGVRFKHVQIWGREALGSAESSFEPANLSLNTPGTFALRNEFGIGAESVAQRNGVWRVQT